MRERLECSHVVSAWFLMFCALTLGCGGNSGHNANMPSPPTPGNNVQPVVVNSGPANNYANGLFTKVKVCVPSSSNCQTIDGILVDTGSYGLRLLSSTGGGSLTLSLPPENAGNGNPLAECAGFVSGFTWGPIKIADVFLAGETANNLPVQIIDSSFIGVPQPCKNSGVPENDTLQTLGANGILGIGPFGQDCGTACQASGASNPGWYYACSANACEMTPVPLANQLQNPITLFAQDNNGVIVELPEVSAASPTLSGSLIFGIGTQSNNKLGASSIFTINSKGEFSTSFKSQSYPAFIDSGSNGYFFLDDATTGLMACSDNNGFYCPPSTLSLYATTKSGSTNDIVKFSISNADTLFSRGANFVFNSLGGPNPGSFDWGLPFFFGRNVYTAIEAHSTPAGVGPYWAY